MKRLITLTVILAMNIGNSYSQRAKTVFQGDFSNWTCENYTFRTAFMNDWDSWSCDNTKIRTVFSNDWDEWQIGQATLKTSFPNDFDGWIITGYGKTIIISATFIDDLERWDVSGAVDGIIRTVFSENFEQWALDIEFDGLEEDLQKAIMFLPIFISFHNEL